jgi:hypothetical protein
MRECVARGWQAVALIASGILIGVLLLGGLHSLPTIGDDARAQGGETWQAADFFYCDERCTQTGWFYDGAPVGSFVTVPQFLETIGSACQLEPMMLPGGDRFVLFYAC